MTPKTKSRIGAFTLLVAVAAMPLAAGAEAPAKARCGCRANGDQANQSTRISSLLGSGKPIEMADAGSVGLPKTTTAALDRLVAIQKSLAADSLDHVAHQAKAIAKAVHAHEIDGLAHETAAQADSVAGAKDIKKVREAFKKLNASFVAFLKQNPDKSGTYRIAYCPMAKADWVQTGDTIANPYFGSSMLKCGSFKN